MSDPILFVTTASILLLMPGPTNVLLVTSGAAAGLRASLLLVLAAILGYAAAIALLVFGVGPLIRAVPSLDAIFKLLAACWLLWVAAALWVRGSLTSQQHARLDPRGVFLTTILNPKALVLAFVVVPHLFDGHLAQAVPYLASLCLLIALSGIAWLALGAMLGPTVSRLWGGGAAQRVGSAAQTAFAGLLVSSVLWK
jgi:threonine/homoserine/homoserine lactone efflux protein